MNPVGIDPDDPLTTPAHDSQPFAQALVRDEQADQRESDKQREIEHGLSPRLE